MELKLNGVHVLQTVEFDDYSWFFRFSDADWIRAGCLWRLLIDGAVRRTSNDHGQWFGLSAPVDLPDEVMKPIEGRAVSAIAWDDKTGDLMVTLGSDVCLQLLVDSGGYESWEMNFDGEHYLATGGGSVIQL